jgi:hypothetical protein
VFDTKRIMSACVYMFGRVCFIVSKILKLKYTRLRHMTRLARRVKRVRDYMCLTHGNTYSTYKFNKF